ncbi:ankyrin repeat domain-containing protein, partial [Salmonella sp. s51228]|uniref:ankyrin repeat domain-containing protein n=1 Tax=Salmonella sp. s51228 TaxID=3159652 RepID=UPI0039812998
LAAAHGYVKVARYVLENHLIDVNATDEDNWTPLHAAYNWGNQKIIKLLVVYKADSSVLSKDYFTPEDLGKDK